MTAAESTRDARRSVVDHIFSLVSESSMFDSLVLRGSETMRAWFPELAREPGDIDFVVMPTAVVTLDPLDPYPYLDRLDAVQLSPEYAHGAGQSRMWTFEEFDTSGLRVTLPPEGLHWVGPEEWDDPERLHDTVIERVRENPRTATGVVVDAETVRVDATWEYADYGVAASDGGARLVFPWRADDDSTGTLQIDFAYEPLPEPPVLTAIPRGDGQPPVAMWTATRDLSLAWKLQWLAIDHASNGRCAGKDVYDAVLLAESDGRRLSSRLRYEINQRVQDPIALRPSTVRGWTVDWSGLPTTVTSQPWLERLSVALESLLDQ